MYIGMPATLLVRRARAVWEGSRRRCKSSYIHRRGDTPLRYITVGQALERAAHAWPGREVVVAVQEQSTLLYSELLTQADRFAAALLSIGLCPGDRVGIWCPNSTQWIVTMMACARAGLISVAINPAYEKNEIAYCLEKVNVKCLVAHETVKSRDYYRLLAELLPGLNTSSPGQLRDRDIVDLNSVVLVTDNDWPGVYNYKKLLESADATAADEVARRQHLVSPDSGCNLQLTSGTTGRPKAPLLSHYNMVNNSYFLGRRNELDIDRSKICVQVPLFHVFGALGGLCSGIQHGATLVLPSSTYSPSANLRALVTHKCTTILGTPTMYVDLVSAARKSGAERSARVAVTGGALVSPQLVRDVASTLRVETVKSMYGMTETTGVSFQSLPGEELDVVTESVGCVHDHLEVKVCDAEGRLVEFGTPGELHVRGYTTTLGYWADEEKTKETFIDGWVRTGDQVVLQEDGYCRVVGRLKDFMIRGGENVAPKEIEDVISDHPDVLECHVFGVSDARLGEEICAAIRFKDGRSLTKDQVVDHCTGKIAQYKLPRYVKRVDSFPKTASGKVQKYKLKEMAERGDI